MDAEYYQTNQFTFNSGIINQWFFLCFKGFSVCNSSHAPSVFSTPSPECKQMGKSESRRKLSKERKWLLMNLLAVPCMSQQESRKYKQVFYFVWAGLGIQCRHLLETNPQCNRMWFFSWFGGCFVFHKPYPFLISCHPYISRWLVLQE